MSIFINEDTINQILTVINECRGSATGTQIQEKLERRSEAEMAQAQVYFWLKQMVQDQILEEEVRGTGKRSRVYYRVHPGRPSRQSPQGLADPKTV